MTHYLAIFIAVWCLLAVVVVGGFSVVATIAKACARRRNDPLGIEATMRQVRARQVAQDIARLERDCGIGGGAA